MCGMPEPPTLETPQEAVDVEWIRGQAVRFREGNTITFAVVTEGTDALAGVIGLKLHPEHSTATRQGGS